MQMNRRTNSFALLGAMASAALFQGCQGAASPSEAEAVADAPVAARPGTIPNNLGSLPVWTLSDYETISYYLEGAFKTSPTWTVSAREAFREWSAAILDRDHHVRFVETTDKASANIVVTNGTSYQGGCVDQTRVRYCNLTLPSGAYLLKGIGQIMGIPASTGAGDVMNVPSSNAIFSPADLGSIILKYGRNTNGYQVLPVFNARYSAGSGSEVVIGWDGLRTRSSSGSVTVSASLANRRMVVAALPGGAASAWEYVQTFGILTYPVIASGTTSGYRRWSFLNDDYSIYSPFGLKGADPAPGVLGYPACADASIAPMEGARWMDAPQLFAFDPAKVFLNLTNPFGNTARVQAGSPWYGEGVTVPVWFYKDNATGSYAVSAGAPSGSVSCARLGGYGFAVN